MNCTVWIIECAPTSIRGAMGAMQEFSMAIGSYFECNGFDERPNHHKVVLVMVMVTHKWREYPMRSKKDTSIAGSLVCQTLGLPFSNETLWPWIFAPNAPLVLLCIGLFMLIPDSPVSIMEREGDVTKVRV